MHSMCGEVWQNAQQLYGWRVGRDVLMPDHVHFFCAPSSDSHPLEIFVGKWKKWTSKYAHRRLGLNTPLWQKEFFDHVLRSSENYAEKSEYVRHDPLRAKLVSAAEDWPYQGELHDLRYD